MNCVACGKPYLAHNEVGLCKKMLGRDIENFYCYECLADFLDVTVEELFDKIEEFKDQGCKLFE
jgi:hypothetical protein